LVGSTPDTNANRNSDTSRRSNSRHVPAVLAKPHTLPRASHDIPVIDLAGLGQLAESPLYLGGVLVPNFYAPGGFHPSTAAQGILGNTILDAFATAYNPGLTRFELTDQRILDDAGIAHPRGHSFNDVGPYVLYSSPCGGYGDNGAATAMLDRLFIEGIFGAPGEGHSANVPAIANR
jgi:hypothetical protein